MARTDKEIGGTIRQLRVASGMSQADLAEALGERGIKGMHPQTVAKIESGDRVLKYVEGVTMAAILAVDAAALARGDSKFIATAEYVLTLERRLLEWRIEFERLIDKWADVAVEVADLQEARRMIGEADDWGQLDRLLELLDQDPALVAIRKYEGVRAERGVDRAWQEALDRGLEALDGDDGE